MRSGPKKKIDTMGITRVDIKVSRIDKPDVSRAVRDVVVDTSATVSAIPLKVAKQLGIEFPVKRKFTLATGRTVIRRVGSAWIEVDGRKTSDDVITMTRGTPLLSVRALEGLGFEVDPRTKRLRKLEGSFLL